MITFIKEIRGRVAVNQMRLHLSTYSQIRHYYSLEKLPSPWKIYPLYQPRRHRFENLPETHNAIKFRTLFSSAALSSSVDHDEDALSVNADVSELEEMNFEHVVDAETEDDLAHLRVKLYELSRDVGDKTNEYMERLYEAASIQQVFDVIDEHEKSEGSINIKIASQALVTIWDLQKFLFNINANFDPERDYFSKPTFIEKVSHHPIFLEKIVKPVVDNCESLDDEPLLATLLCLKRMHYDMRSSECQKFIEECLRRSETLSLPSVSRLCVCMRTESLYGNFIVAKFYPLLANYIDKMSTDIEVRLVAISLRNTLRIITGSMADKFRAKICSLLTDDMKKWETVTLCKIFLLLIACRNLGSDSKHLFDLVGESLIDRVPKMQLMDLLSLQKFLELGFMQPYGLVEALVNRMMRVVQEGVSTSTSPRMDLLASVSPYLKSIEQRKQLALMLQDYLENHNFELASGMLFVILRWARSTNVNLYDLLWSKATEMVAKKSKDNVLERRVLKLGRDYLNFCYGMGFGYRNRDFEQTVKEYLYQLIDNYSQGVQPCLLQPGDFSRAFTFLIGCAVLSDPLFSEIEVLRILDDFAPQFRPHDLVVLSRGLESIVINLFYQRRPPAKYYDRVLEICSILDEQCSRILLNNKEVGFYVLLAIHKSALVTRRVKGESPILDLTMQRILKSEIKDSKSVKDLAQHLLNGKNNYPEATQKIEDFIWNCKESAVSPEVIEKFVILAFCIGWEVNSNNDIFGLCGQVLTKDWDKLTFLGLLQSSLGLCFFRRLSKELVQNIFSVEFLDQLDAELATSYKTNQYPLRLRQAMMELNRAVCIDMPDVNLPWFHGNDHNFHNTVNVHYILGNIPDNYLHREIRKVLGNIVGDDTAVQANIYSPYFYPLDFLIEFDKKDRPIKRNRRQPKGFFQKFIRENSESADGTIGRKVAVLILSHNSFTRSNRSIRGQLKLRKRHLEILGYDVIEIDPMYWNSMFMSENSMRHSFLESKLYANASSV